MKLLGCLHKLARFLVDAVHRWLGVNIAGILVPPKP